MDATKKKQIKSDKLGYRNTFQRDLVFDAVRTMGNHPTSDEVYDVVKEGYRDISKATVYRNLNVLVQTGKLIRVEVPQGAARYDATLNPHGHAHCRSCGNIFDVDLKDAKIIDVEAVDAGDFCIEHCRVIFDGLCADCVSSKESAKGY